MRRVLEGTIMKDREFDDDEIDYLRSLPAVNSVGRNRIRYTDQFREYCMPVSYTHLTLPTTSRV